MARKLTRKELTLIVVAIPVLLLLDQYFMSTEVARGSQIVSVITSKFEAGEICTDSKRHLVCLAEKLVSYPLKMSSAPVLGLALLSARMDALSKTKDSNMRLRIDEEYCLAISAALSRILQRSQDTDMYRPSELYARRAFLDQSRETLSKIKDVIDRIEGSYREIGSTINMNRGELTSSYESLRALATNEMTRSDINSFLNSMLP